MTRARILGWALPVVVVATAVVWFVVLLGDDAPTPVDLQAAVPNHATLGALVAASDLVVEGEVVSVDPGRVLTDPKRPDVGVRTQLVELTVIRSVGAAPLTIVLEQEAALLDGTPITVNGITPLREGEHGVAFLIEGDEMDAPYTALTVPDSWITVDDGILTDTKPVAPVLADWIGRSADDLVDAASAGET